jgi:hypothetical protein
MVQGAEIFLFDFAIIFLHSDDTKLHKCIGEVEFIVLLKFKEL